MEAIKVKKTFIDLNVTGHLIGTVGEFTFFVELVPQFRKQSEDNSVEMIKEK